MTGRSAIFLDRDGTIIEDLGYLSCADQVRLLDGALVVLRRLAEAGFALVVVSNQSGIGRGSVTEAQAASVHASYSNCWMPAGSGSRRLLRPHVPEQGCVCRKPSKELLMSAGRELGIEMASSFMVGDQLTDLVAGRCAGCHAVAFGPPIPCPPAWAASAADWPALGRLLLGPR